MSIMMEIHNTMRKSKFCGQKMKHVFRTGFDDKNDKDADDASDNYVPVFDPEFRVGPNMKVYRKIDGSNGALFVGDDKSVHLLKRYDCKTFLNKASTPKYTSDQLLETYFADFLIPVPTTDGPGPFTYTSGSTNHMYFQKYVSRPAENTKNGAEKIDLAIYKVAEKHIDRLSPGLYSCEFVGRKFNFTPGVEDDVAIAIHSDQVFTSDFEFAKCDERSFYDIFASYFKDVPMEGVIVMDDNGRFWKIHARLFEGNRWKTNRADASRPVLLGD